MSNILIIPDVHGRKFWRKCVESNESKVDKIIFLGDYLDPYQAEIDDNKDLMECDHWTDSYHLSNMLNDIISLKKENPNKYVLLTGNHSDSYIWSKFSSATRTDYEHWEQYHKIFSENLDYFNVCWIEDDVIFSHAGITEDWADDFLYSSMKYDEGAELEKGSLVFETARVLKDTPLKNFNKYYIDSISHISHHRGGNYFHGSCEWADLIEHVDIDKSTPENIVANGRKGIYQIFGHTQLKQALINDKWACLDCRKGFIINTKTFDINEC